MTADLTIAWCDRGEVSSKFMESMLDCVNVNVTEGYLHNVAGPRVASARNQLIDVFLEHASTDWLLFSDADMIFTPTDVKVLRESADAQTRPIVGGLCFTCGKEQIRPTLYQLVEGDTFDIQPIWDYPRDAMCEVDATGAAFILIHRSVLVAMKEHFGPQTAYPWFAESERDLIEIGEDQTFCLRARGLGFPVHVNTAVEIGHEKTRNVCADAYWAWRRAFHKANTS